ncbi:MAG: hypothetical protein LBP19_01880 [Treponema sp.]|jgi:TolB-like protein|nr:hypothetical protein [Treponema sp.]
MKKIVLLMLFLSAAIALYAGGGKEKAAQQELAQQEAARQEAQRQEAARQEAARQEAERQEAARLEAERQEAERRRQGYGISLAVLVPEGNSLSADQSYLPTLVQGEFVKNFAKYSLIRVLDRQNLEKVLQETESGIYRNEEDFVRLGEVTQMNHALTGSVTKTSAGYALQIQITPTTAGEDTAIKAAYSAACTVAELDDLSAIKKASLELLTQMGINISDAAKEELSGADSRQTVQAQTALARGITAQKGGTVVEALSYYFQAADYDPSIAEAVSRASVLSADITSGNIGEDVRNDILWRRQWTTRLTEAEQYYANYTKGPVPYYLVYSTELKQGAINYENETVPISFTIELLPNTPWLSTAGRVVNTVRQGLRATKRAEAWGFNEWPHKSVSQTSPFVDKVESFIVEVELVNADGKVIGRLRAALKGGWKTVTTTTAKTFNVADSQFPVHKIVTSSKASTICPLQIQPNWNGGTVTFSDVDAALITDRLTIRIAGIDGKSADAAARDKRINILTEAQYAMLPETRAGVDARSIRQVIGQFSTVETETRLTLTDYNGSSKNVVIPSHIFGLPIISIGDFAFEETALMSVIIPDSVTSIGILAFS